MVERRADDDEVRAKKVAVGEDGDAGVIGEAAEFGLEGL